MSSADALAATIGSGQTDPDTTEATEEVVESQEEVDETTEAPETTETEDQPEEEELPANIKDILSKNRKAVREAEARAIAAEKALAARDKAPEAEETAPVDEKFKTLFVNTAAKAALADAGLSVGTDRFLKMLDLSSVEVDDSGNVSGLDDQIADLKEEFKDLLAPKVVKKPVTKVDGAGRRETPEVPKSSAERLAARLG
jgi:hypothetical protein